MKKRSIALFLATTMSLSLFAGCAAPTAEAPESYQNEVMAAKTDFSL